MIQTERTNDVQRGGVVKKTACNIVVNAKAFEMLARQYSNPIKAIVQELSANALDSHARAGKATEPFKVKLPNALDSHFKVRDFGVSMSPETIYDVYINYMKSDKTTSNNEVGCFGIGSKTPFAYTDSFNITTFLTGVKRLYNLSYNELGIPELNEFGESATTENDGVEISFAVKENDYSRFIETATNVYKYFDVKPVVSGNNQYKGQDVKKILSGNGWYFSDGDTSNSIVVMGNIAYPVDRYQFDSKYHTMLSSGVIFTVGIGEMNVTPSRESLEYSSFTIKTIKKYLDAIYTEVCAEITASVEKETNYWSAVLRAKDLSTRLSFVKVQDLRWKGRTLAHHIEVPISKKFWAETYNNNRVRTEIYNSDSHVDINTKTVFVVKDTSIKSNVKAKWYAKQNIGKIVFLISPDEDYLVALDGDATASGIYRDLKGLTGDNGIVFYSSELPDVPKVKVSGVTRGKRQPTVVCNIREFRPNRDGDSSTGRRYRYEQRSWKTFESFDISAIDEFVYVEFNNYSVELNDKEILNFEEIVKGIQASGIDIPAVYGVTKVGLNKVKKNDNAIDFLTWFKDNVLEDDDVYEKVVNSLTASTIAQTHRFISSIGEWKGFNVSAISEGSYFRKLIEQVIPFVKGSESISPRFIEYYLGIKGLAKEGIRPDTAKISKLADRVAKDYPLVISFIEHEYRFSNESYSNIINTVNAIDVFKSLDK